MSFGNFLAYQCTHNTSFVVSLLILTPIQLVFIALSLNNDSTTFWDWIKLIPITCDIISASILVYNEPKNKLRRFLLLGFIFSFGGDFFLIVMKIFIPGLASFAMAHVCYILAFSLPPTPDHSNVKLNLLRGLPFVGVFIGIPTPVIAHMATTGGPVVLMVAIYFYSGIIGIMGWRAAARINYPTESLVSQIIALLAAVIFISSDSMIAYSKFFHAFPNHDLYIMITYWIAQYMFLISLMRTKYDYETLPINE